MRRAENLLESGVLLHLFLCAALTAQVQYNAQHGFLLPSSYETARQAVFFLVAVLSVCAAVGLDVMWPFSAAAAAAIPLPVVERLAGSAYPDVYKRQRTGLKDTWESAMLLCVPVVGSDQTVYGVCGVEVSALYFQLSCPAVWDSLAPL